jgi:ATP-dependent Clp protease protease subunit
MPKTEKDTTSSASHRVEDKIESSILDARRIFLYDAVDSDSSREVIRKLWYLDIIDPGKPITIIINSPGGEINSGFAVWDQINMLQSPVVTIVSGLAASMASVLSLAAPKGKRFATPNARFMIHQPLIGGVIRGQATDLEIQATEILKTRNIIIKIYAEATGKSEETIEKAIDRDTWLSAKEALEYGLIDKIVSSHKDLSF